MNLLLDTHILLWWLAEPRKLSRAVFRAIESPENMVFVSSISIWEMQLKSARGKLRFPDDLEKTLARNHFQELPLRIAHVQGLAQILGRNSDPFDRILAAQAKVEKLTFVSHDSQAGEMGVHVLIT